MKVSHQWLGKYVDLSHISIDRLAEIMTEIGLEVEGYEKIENIKGGLKGIVVGKVVECHDHPNADKLKLTKVDVGEEEKLNIVCGAPNVAKGQKVPVALQGTTLYDEDDRPFTIKKGKIRGEVSEGMICSEVEIGISQDHSGIMVLPEEYEVGKPFDQYYEVREDYIIHVELTPNRADATHHKGVAFDISAYLRTNNKGKEGFIDRELKEIPAPVEDLEINVQVEDEDACPRYTGIVISGIEVRPSPPWLQERLKAIGIRPLNNVIDTTNFVLHDIGQPLHAFDYEKIKDKRLLVKKLNAGTTFVTLEGTERKLTGEELMICDGHSNPLCMAGIFGGKGSGVSESTKTIFLEAAYFDAKTIRKASMHHQLRTDAAKIYEKGADPNQVIPALQLAVEILMETASAKVASNVKDTLPEGMPRPEIEVKFSKVRQYLGIEISKKEITSILEALDFTIQKEDNELLHLRVPTSKPDVSREVDVIEEIIRIYGLGEIPVADKFSLKVSPAQYPDNFHYREKVGQALVGSGLTESMSLSLLPSDWYEGQDVYDQLVFINNTSNQDLNALRPDMVSCNLSNIQYNVNRQNRDLSFFEFGKVYWKALDSGYKEEERLSLALTGSFIDRNWIASKGKSSDFFVLKTFVEKVFKILNVEGFQISPLDESPYFAYGLQWHRGPKVLAEFGKARNAWLERFDIEEDVFIADIRWGACVRAAQRTDVVFEPISKYPGVERDLALVLDRKVNYDEVKSTIYATGKELIKDVNLFDVYRNEEQLGKLKKSYAVRITFESHEKTLSEKDIDQRMKKIIQSLEKRLDAKLR